MRRHIHGTTFVDSGSDRALSVDGILPAILDRMCRPTSPTSATPLFSSSYWAGAMGVMVTTTFALPDLRGHAPLPSLAYYLSLRGEYPTYVDGYIGTISLFPYAAPPEQWVVCEGQQLEIRTNSPLYALLMNRFGGDGRTTFALPDLRGNAPAGHMYAMNMVGSFPEEAAPVLFPLGTIFLAPYADSRAVPGGCLACEGQALRFLDYEALSELGFSVSGETFVLPDLRDRVPMPGLRYFITVAGDFPNRWSGTLPPG